MQPKEIVWVVQRLQDLSACDTNNIGTRRLGKTYFATFEEAKEFYERRCLSVKFAGLAGEYYSYPFSEEK